MKIYIPTRSRVNSQITWKNLTPRLRKKVVFVVNYDEHNTIGHLIPIWPEQQLVCKPKINTIGLVRQFIVDQHDVKKDGAHIIMLDDDLSFFQRRLDDPTKFLPIGDAELDYCFQMVDRLLTTYANVGILAREGGNRQQSEIIENTRLLRALAYNVPVLRKVRARFDRLIVMEDFDVALQLLRAGHKTAAVGSWVQDQKGSNAPGGCSDYRTLERQAEGARGLAKLHAPFVKVVEKTTKTAWQGTTRLDVIVRWKDAYASSQKKETK